jgi:hypothetical protein
MVFASLSAPSLSLTVRVSDCSVERVKFENGVFVTEDPVLIAGLEAHPMFGRFIRSAKQEHDVPPEVPVKAPEIAPDEPVVITPSPRVLKKKKSNKDADDKAIKEFMGDQKSW